MCIVLHGFTDKATSLSKGKGEVVSWTSPQEPKALPVSFQAAKFSLNYSLFTTSCFLSLLLQMPFDLVRGFSGTSACFLSSLLGGKYMLAGDGECGGEEKQFLLLI